MVEDSAENAVTSWPTIASGTKWNAFFAACDARLKHVTEEAAKPANEFVSKMPYQKATCFGIAPVDNARYLRLMRCNQCNRIIKHVGYAHHMRRRHSCNSYESNGSISADEAPDFLLSPPYNMNSSYKQAAINIRESPMSYVSEKRDGLLLVLKRARIPTIPEETEVDAIKSEPAESKNTPTSSGTSGKLSVRRVSKVQQATPSRPNVSSNPDCVASRTRNRQPKTSSYVELPAPTRQMRNSISKIIIRKTSDSSRNSAMNSPASVIVLDEDSTSKHDGTSRQSGLDNEPVEFSFVLPKHHDHDYCASNEELSRSLPPTTVNSDGRSSRSSSIQSVTLSSKTLQTTLKSEGAADTLPTVYADNGEYLYAEDDGVKDTPQSSMDYQNDNSLPSSSSPEMPQLERQDLYPQVEEHQSALDSAQDSGVYSTSSNVTFSSSALLFTPTAHHQSHPFQQHAIYNGSPVQSINTYSLGSQNVPTSLNNSHQQQPPSSQQQVGRQSLAFFYSPTTVATEPFNNQLKSQRKRQSVEVVPMDRNQQIKRKKVTVVGGGTQLKATSINPAQHQPRRRVFNGQTFLSPGMTTQQLARLQVVSKPSTQFDTKQPMKLPPPIIISSPSRKSSLLLQRNRAATYSPVVVNYVNGRSNSSPSSANYSSTSNNPYIGSQSVENVWFNNFNFSNELIYYNDPSVRNQHLDDFWKPPSKSFQLETRDHR